MQDGTLQGTFTQIVIQWRVGFPQKGGKATPVTQQIRDRPAQAVVWFRLLFRQLIFNPAQSCIVAERTHNTSLLSERPSRTGRRVSGARPRTHFSSLTDVVLMGRDLGWSRKLLRMVGGHRI